MYHLKLFESNTANNSGNNLTNQDQQGNNDNTHVIASYPLCNYCLIKLRKLCDFFAKIRLIRSNIFKLKQNDSFDEFIVVPGSFGHQILFPIEMGRILHRQHHHPRLLRYLHRLLQPQMVNH